MLDFITRKNLSKKSRIFDKLKMYDEVCLLLLRY